MTERMFVVTVEVKIAESAFGVEARHFPTLAASLASIDARVTFIPEALVGGGSFVGKVVGVRTDGVKITVSEV